MRYILAGGGDGGCGGGVSGVSGGGDGGDGGGGDGDVGYGRSGGGRVDHLLTDSCCQ